jgi:hypothetical protein
MAVEDRVIAAYLDNTWRTVPSVHWSLPRRDRPRPEHTASALRRLADAGKIERRKKSTTVPKVDAPGTTFHIEFYRRLS